MGLERSVNGFLDPWYSFINDFLYEVWSYIKNIVRYIAELFLSLPFFVQAIFFVLLSLAIIGILTSHFIGVNKNRKIWKKYPNSNLMYSYFCGSGALQRKLMYKEAHHLLRDRKWAKFSLASLAYRLGILTNPSKILLFISSFLYIPIAILGFIEMVFRVVIGTIWLLLASFIQRFILFILACFSYALMPIFVIVDKKSRIDQHCTNCYATFNPPAYKCPYCGKTHKQLIPGRRGLFLSRCQCGRFLPCSMLAGRSRLQAVCPVCEFKLLTDNAKQFYIQLIGDNSSGKTAFLAAFQHLYLNHTESVKNLTVTVDPKSHFDALENMYCSGQTSPSSATQTVSYSFLHKSRRKTLLNLVVFDVPDEVIINGSFERNPRNIGFSDGIVFIVDPLSIPCVRAEAHGEAQIDKYSDNNVGALIIEYIHQLSRITGRESGRLSDIPIAVVINKADIEVVKREIGQQNITAVYSANPKAFGKDIKNAQNEICRAYLSKMGLANVLNNLDGTFTNIQFFSASSIGHTHQSGNAFNPFGVLEPFAWVLNEKRSVFSKLLK